MNMLKLKHVKGIMLLLPAVGLLCAVLINCSSSDDPPPPTESQTRLNVPISDQINNVQISAGQNEVSFVYTLPAGTSTFDTISVNLQDSLNAGFVNTAGLKTRVLKTMLAAMTASSANAASTAEMSVRIGSSTDPDVCQNGILYGPYTINLNDSDEPVTVSPATAEATPATVSIVNTGAFTVCLLITSPVDGTFSASNVAVDREACLEEPANFHGYWIGTYSCDNTPCSDNVNEHISLSVTQDGSSATYTDFEADYEGTVCGNTFKFDGGNQFFSEYGSLVMNSDGTATKTSFWIAADKNCSGNCTDQLHRPD